MKNIVECVPNFSEGRDRGVTDQIVAAIQSVPGLTVMDLQMDADHHRSVITFVGEKGRVSEGALRAIGKAAELIDLTRHVGAHPRIGATDVVPFIPVKNVTLDECVSIARQVGEEAARRFSIPIYLYEAAATRPDRTHLENIRRGQFEELRQQIESSPERFPDFGPARIHPTAGATVVGARKFLIAYNVNLTTSDVSIAKRIAKAVRFSSGGLPCVKALGITLKTRDQAQVSMNLTDFEETPIHRVFEMVRAEAKRNGTSIAGSEIVGLIPQKAIELSAEFYLQVENFRPGQIFENRLLEILDTPSKALTDLKVSEFLESVARRGPGPGGGSVAALAGALAAALGKMVVAISLHGRDPDIQLTRFQRHLARLQEVCEVLTRAIVEDTQAYASVVAAQGLPNNTKEEQQLREQRLRDALQLATTVPLNIAENARSALVLLIELRTSVNSNVVSDLNVGFWMAVAAAQGALETVAVNLSSLPESEFVADARQRGDRIRTFLKQTCLNAL